MLSLLIPPIIIVISLSLVIFIFYRKSKEISGEKKFKEKEEIAKESRIKKILKIFKLSNFFRLIIVLVSFVIIGIKFVFIKFYQTLIFFPKIFIQRKKNRMAKIEQEIKEEENEKKKMKKKLETEDEFKREFKREKNKKDKDEYNNNESDNKISREELINNRLKEINISELNNKVEIEEEDEDEENQRPAISDTVTRPDNQNMVKNKLEEILIDRIAANPQDLEAYERLGEYYIENQNLEDAKQCYKHVLKLSPYHRRAKIQLKRIEDMLNSN